VNAKQIPVVVCSLYVHAILITLYVVHLSVVEVSVFPIHNFRSYAACTAASGFGMYETCMCMRAES